MWVILFVVIVTLFAIFKYRVAFKGYENVDNMFPGLPPRFLVGNALEFYGDPHFLFTVGLKLQLLFRRSFRVWIGPMLFICLVTPEEAEALLNNTTHIKKSTIYAPLVPWVGFGLLTSYGQKWKTHRKTLTPAFHFKILESFLDIFNENSKVFSTKLEGMVGKASFNVLEIVKLYALDNICETAMGTSISAQKNPNSEYVKSIKAMLHITFLRCMRPWLQPDFLFKWTKHASVQKKALAYLHGFSRSVINKRIQERKVEFDRGEKKIDEDNDIGAKTKKVFLDMLLDAFDEGIVDVDEVQEQVDTFMFEGHDTVTSALSFALYSLAYHPEYQDKVYEELMETFGEDNRPPTFEDLNKMKYMEMVIKETLRLYPSVPVYGRKLDEDLKLDEGATCPKGAEVQVFVPCVHRDPKSWQRPNEFYPDHFLPELVANRHPYAHIPFSAGPRNCIGLKFAMMEMKMTLCQVLRKFRMVPANPRVEVKLMAEVILQSQSGVMIAIEERNPV